MKEGESGSSVDASCAQTLGPGYKHDVIVPGYPIFGQLMCTPAPQTPLKVHLNQVWDSVSCQLFERGFISDDTIDCWISL